MKRIPSEWAQTIRMFVFLVKAHQKIPSILEALSNQVDTMIYSVNEKSVPLLSSLVHGWSSDILWTHKNAQGGRNRGCHWISTHKDWLDYSDLDCMFPAMKINKLTTNKSNFWFPFDMMSSRNQPGSKLLCRTPFILKVTVGFSSLE